MPQKIRLSDLTLDPRLQMRAQLNERHVQDLAELLDDDPKFRFRDPLRVFLVTGDDGASRYLLVDGFHRFAALQRSRRKKADCDVTEGSWRDAFTAALGANATHGLRRSNQDKLKAVLVALLDPELGEMSDRELADIVGVSNGLVSRIHRAFEVLRLHRAPAPLEHAADTLGDGYSLAYVRRVWALLQTLRSVKVTHPPETEPSESQADTEIATDVSPQFVEDQSRASPTAECPICGESPALDGDGRWVLHRAIGSLPCPSSGYTPDETAAARAAGTFMESRAAQATRIDDAGGDRDDTPPTEPPTPTDSLTARRTEIRGLLDQILALEPDAELSPWPGFTCCPADVPLDGLTYAELLAVGRSALRVLGELQDEKDGGLPFIVLAIPGVLPPEAAGGENSWIAWWETPPAPGVRMAWTVSWMMDSEAARRRWYWYATVGGDGRQGWADTSQQAARDAQEILLELLTAGAPEQPWAAGTRFRSLQDLPALGLGASEAWKVEGRTWGPDREPSVRLNARIDGVDRYTRWIPVVELQRYITAGLVEAHSVPEQLQELQAEQEAPAATQPEEGAASDCDDTETTREALAAGRRYVVREPSTYLDGAKHGDVWEVVRLNEEGDQIRLGRIGKRGGILKSSLVWMFVDHLVELFDDGSLELQEGESTTTTATTDEADASPAPSASQPPWPLWTRFEILHGQTGMKPGETWELIEYVLPFDDGGGQLKLSRVGKRGRPTMSTNTWWDVAKIRGQLDAGQLRVVDTPAGLLRMLADTCRRIGADQLHDDGALTSALVARFGIHVETSNHHGYLVSTASGERLRVTWDADRADPETRIELKGYPLLRAVRMALDRHPAGATWSAPTATATPTTTPTQDTPAGQLALPTPSPQGAPPAPQAAAVLAPFDFTGQPKLQQMVLDARSGDGVSDGEICAPFSWLGKLWVVIDEGMFLGGRWHFDVWHVEPLDRAAKRGETIYTHAAIRYRRTGERREVKWKEAELAPADRSDKTPCTACGMGIDKDATEPHQDAHGNDCDGTIQAAEAAAETAASPALETAAPPAPVPSSNPARHFEVFDLPGVGAPVLDGGCWHAEWTNRKMRHGRADVGARAWSVAPRDWPEPAHWTWGAFIEGADPLGGTSPNLAAAARQAQRALREAIKARQVRLEREKRLSPVPEQLAGAPATASTTATTAPSSTTPPVLQNPTPKDVERLERLRGSAPAPTSAPALPADPHPALEQLLDVLQRTLAKPASMKVLWNVNSPLAEALTGWGAVAKHARHELRLIPCPLCQQIVEHEGVFVEHQRTSIDAPCPASGLPAAAALELLVDVKAAG